MKLEVTFIGTLSPIKGLSPYCEELLISVSDLISVEFIGFKQLYPDFLYPGGTRIKDENYSSEIKNGLIRNILTYYTPVNEVNG